MQHALLSCRLRVFVELRAMVAAHRNKPGRCVLHKIQRTACPSTGSEREAVILNCKSTSLLFQEVRLRAGLSGFE